MNEIEFCQMIATALEAAASAPRVAKEDAASKCASGTGEPPYRPGRAHADFYLCGAAALAEWRDRVGGDFTVFKAGLTQQGVADRQNDLREDVYASCRKVGGQLTKDPGFDQWEMRRIPSIALSRDQAMVVKFVPRAVRLSLGGQRFDVVERRLRRNLAGFSLSAWSAVPANSARLKKAGIDVKRWTNARFGDQAVPKRSSELYVIKPRAHLPRIISALVSAATAGDR